MPQIIQGPADWRGPEIAKSQRWIHQFSPAEVSEIDSAFRTAKARGRTIATLERDDFPLPTVRHVLAHALDELENGLGLFHMRGLPTAPYSKDDLRMIYWGLGKHIGTAVSQSPDGDLLGDVRDIGVDLHGPKGRGYRSKQKLTCHTDTCDVVGLMVLRTAMSGGLSILASSVAIHNEIARTRPDLLEVLYQPFWWSWQGQEPPGDKPYYPEPVFTFHNGKFSCRYVRTVIQSGQRYPEVPRMTPAQEEAIELVDDARQQSEVSLRHHVPARRNPAPEQPRRAACAHVFRGFSGGGPQATPAAHVAVGAQFTRAERIVPCHLSRHCGRRRAGRLSFAHRQACL